MQEVRRVSQIGRVEYVLPPAVFELLRDLPNHSTKTLCDRSIEVCGITPGPCWCGQHKVGPFGAKIRTVEVRACSKCGTLTRLVDLNLGICSTCYPLPAKQVPAAAEEPNGQAGPTVPTIQAAG
jgi:hypothetical protein